MHGAVSSPAATEWLVWVALLDAVTGATDEARRIVTDLTRDGSSAIAMNANWHGAASRRGRRRVGPGRPPRCCTPCSSPTRTCSHSWPVPPRASGRPSTSSAASAWTLGRHEEAEARLRRAVSANDEAGAASRAAFAQLSLGELLHDRGDRDGARDALEQAAARAEAFGMPGAVAKGPR